MPRACVIQPAPRLLGQSDAARRDEGARHLPVQLTRAGASRHRIERSPAGKQDSGHRATEELLLQATRGLGFAPLPNRTPLLRVQAWLGLLPSRPPPPREPLRRTGLQRVSPVALPPRASRLAGLPPECDRARRRHLAG